MSKYEEGAVEREFILREKDARGVRVIGWVCHGDPRIHYRVEQEIPEQFFTDVKENAANWSPNATRQTHYQRFAQIPDILRQNWCDEWGVSSLFADEDVTKKTMKRLNSNEFYKLRTGGGNLA